MPLVVLLGDLDPRPRVLDARTIVIPLRSSEVGVEAMIRANATRNRPPLIAAPGRVLETPSQPSRSVRVTRSGNGGPTKSAVPPGLRSSFSENHSPSASRTRIRIW